MTLSFVLRAEPPPVVPLLLPDDEELPAPLEVLPTAPLDEPLVPPPFAPPPLVAPPPLLLPAVPPPPAGSLLQQASAIRGTIIARRRQVLNGRKFQFLGGRSLMSADFMPKNSGLLFGGLLGAALATLSIGYKNRVLLCVTTGRRSFALASRSSDRDGWLVARIPLCGPFSWRACLFL